jgi:hypothetical protein
MASEENKTQSIAIKNLANFFLGLLSASFLKTEGFFLMSS